MLSPSLRTKKNESTPPLGLKCIVPNIYFAFSCRPLGSLIEFPCGGGGGGALQLQCKSESAQCSEKQQSLCEGDEGGGGLKI